MDGEKEGRERNLTTALNRSETGSGRELHAAAKNSGDGFCAHAIGSRGEGKEGENGEEKEERGSHCPLLIRARSRGVDRGGSGAASAVFNREREEIGRRQLEKEMLTGGLGLSAAERERGREGEAAGWPRPRERDAHAGGVWAERPNGEKGENKFLFLFLKQIFKLFSK